MPFDPYRGRSTAAAGVPLAVTTLNPRTDALAFKEDDAASYDRLTAEFEHFTGLLTQPLVGRLIERANLRSGARVLDVGTGTGVVAFAVADALPDAQVLGIDLSTGMLAAAQSKAVASDAQRRIEFRQMDAEALAVPDESFDAVLSLFALLHFPNPLLALREMRRVLRPGGWISLAVGSRPPVRSPGTLIHYARRLPEIGGRFRGRLLTAPAFLDSLVARHCPETEIPEESETAGGGRNRTRAVLRMVAQAGFRNVSWTWNGHTYVARSAEEFWTVQRTFSSIARKRISAAPPSVQAALRAEFLGRAEKVLARGGRLIYPFGAFFIAAQRLDHH